MFDFSHILLSSGCVTPSLQCSGGSADALGLLGFSLSASSSQRPLFQLLTAHYVHFMTSVGVVMYVFHITFLKSN